MTSRITCPKVTILTVVRNAVDEIEDTLRSIADLKTPEAEYIVMDGDSTDGTKDILQRYAGTIDHYSSQPDKGIYDAMNKALRHAHGRYIININAGDRLLALPPEVMSDADTSTAIYCGRVETENGCIRPRWDNSIMHHNTIPHQGCFYRRDLLVEHPYALTDKVFADYDLNLSLYLAGQEVRLLDSTVAFHSTFGVSNQSRHASELFSVIRNRCGRPACLKAWCYFKLQGLKSRWRKLNF